MGRALRAAAGGLVYHVLNRANARLPLFDKDGDYAAFERVLAEARDYCDVPLLAYCVMPNHWHLVVRPRGDGDLSRYVGWLTLTHTQRWHAHSHAVGHGHLYQGRFKSFPIQEDEHLLTVCRYVERNPLRAGLVRRAEDWRWGSLWRRARGGAEAQSLLADWPVPRPRGWVGLVNAAQTLGEEEALRGCIRRGAPFGVEGWVKKTADRLGLATTLRPRGRPKKQPEKGS
jgi:putative transposase